MSKSAGKKPKEKSDKTKADNFVWTDDEVQLLLNDFQMTTRCRKRRKISTGSRASQSTLTSDVSVFPAFTKIYVYSRPHEDA